jgi:hypothetical protein
VDGWRKWLCRTIVVDGSCTWKIKPFRYLRRRDFKSPALQVAFYNKWKPIFSKLMPAPGVEALHRVEHITENILWSSYAMATSYIREKIVTILAT